MERIKRNIELINRYLTISIKQHFGIEIDISGEYTFAENLVSKKMIIAPTFTDRILMKPQIKMFLSSLINELNYEKCNTDFIKDKLNHLKESDSGEMEKIV